MKTFLNFLAESNYGFAVIAFKIDNPDIDRETDSVSLRTEVHIKDIQDKSKLLNESSKIFMKAATMAMDDFKGSEDIDSVHVDMDFDLNIGHEVAQKIKTSPHKSELEITAELSSVKIIWHYAG